jgi:hypothetical protein
MAAAGASVVAMTINAVKAFGVVVRIGPPEFLALPAHAEVVTVQSISIPEF